MLLPIMPSLLSLYPPFSLYSLVLNCHLLQKAPTWAQPLASLLLDEKPHPTPRPRVNQRVRGAAPKGPRWEPPHPLCWPHLEAICQFWWLWLCTWILVLTMNLELIPVCPPSPILGFSSIPVLTHEPSKDHSFYIFFELSPWTRTEDSCVL